MRPGGRAKFQEEVASRSSRQHWWSSTNLEAQAAEVRLPAAAHVIACGTADEAALAVPEGRLPVVALCPTQRWCDGMFRHLRLARGVQPGRACIQKSYRLTGAQRKASKEVRPTLAPVMLAHLQVSTRHVPRVMISARARRPEEHGEARDECVSARDRRAREDERQRRNPTGKDAACTPRERKGAEATRRSGSNRATKGGGATTEQPMPPARSVPLGVDASEVVNALARPWRHQRAVARGPADRNGGEAEQRDAQHGWKAWKGAGRVASSSSAASRGGGQMKDNAR